jgi:hypothetical protein
VSSGVAVQEQSASQQADQGHDDWNKYDQQGLLTSEVPTQSLGTYWTHELGLGRRLPAI